MIVHNNIIILSPFFSPKNKTAYHSQLPVCMSECDFYLIFFLFCFLLGFYGLFNWTKHSTGLFFLSFFSFFLSFFFFTVYFWHFLDYKTTRENNPLQYLRNSYRALHTWQITLKHLPADTWRPLLWVSSVASVSQSALSRCDVPGASSINLNSLADSRALSPHPDGVMWQLWFILGSLFVFTPLLPDVHISCPCYLLLIFSLISVD